MTYDHELLLVKQEIESDELGNQTPVETKRPVLCSVSSVGRSEFYSAAVHGMRPEITFVVNMYDYEGETLVEYQQGKYKVIREYRVNMEEVELTCERVINDGEN